MGISSNLQGEPEEWGAYHGWSGTRASWLSQILFKFFAGKSDVGWRLLEDQGSFKEMSGEMSKKVQVSGSFAKQISGNSSV